MRSATVLEAIETDALDLPAIDLTAADSGAWNLGWDRRTFEERYAELGFGLGTVPRLQRRDDAWWETPLGMMACVVGILALLWIAAAAA